MTDVASQSPKVAAQTADLDLVSALMGGTRAMRAAGKTYMPRMPAESEEAYRERIDCAVLFPAYARTVDTLAAKPFSRPLAIGDDVPAKMRPWLENVDRQGRNLHVFAAEVFRNALAEGFAGILVDYPRAEGVRTLADQQSQGLRPYFVAISKRQILGWRATETAAGWVLSQLRIMEAVTEDDGEFGERDIQQVRVLEPGKWATYRKAEKGEWALHEQGVTTLPVVPFVPVYGRREEFMVGSPPLMNLAHLNVQHWQDSSDQQRSVRFARVRIAAIVGGDPDATLTIGADYFLRLPAGASIEIAQGSAESVKIGREELTALEEQMRQTGAELLVIRPGLVTATQVHSENSVGMSALQRMGADCEDSIDAALQLMAQWVGEPEGGHVALFSDYGVATLSEASAQLLLTAKTSGVLSNETVIAEFKRRGILSADVDADDERERVAAEGPDVDGVTGADGQ